MHLKHFANRFPFIVLLCFCFCTAIAARPAVDSLRQARKPHKLTQQQFLDRYGTDDSSRALINYYFLDRKIAAGLTVKSALSLGLTGVLGGIVLSTSNGDGESWNAFFLLLILLAVAYAAALLLLVGTLLLLLQSRRRLFRLLQTYHNGNGLPRRITRKMAFLRWLKKEQKIDRTPHAN